MSFVESNLKDEIKIIQKEYSKIEDYIQRSRTFIYNEFKMFKQTNVTFESERRMFNQIIENQHDSETIEELTKVKKVFIQCIKDQMIYFQRIIAHHMQLINSAQEQNSEIVESKYVKQLQKQKNDLLLYLLSPNKNDTTKLRNSNKIKLSNTLNELVPFSFAPKKQQIRSFRTLTESDDEESDDFNSHQNIYAA